MEDSGKFEKPSLGFHVRVKIQDGRPEAFGNMPSYHIQYARSCSMHDLAMCCRPPD